MYYSYQASMLDVNQLAIAIETLVENKKGKIKHQDFYTKKKESDLTAECSKLQWKLKVLEDINSKMEEDLEALNRRLRLADTQGNTILNQCCDILSVKVHEQLPECLLKIKKLLSSVSNMENYIKQIKDITQFNPIESLTTITKWKEFYLGNSEFIEVIESLCQMQISKEMLSYIERLIYYERIVSPYINVIQ